MIINQEQLQQLHLFKGTSVPTTIETIDWSQNPKYESDNYVVIEKLVQKSKTYNYYYIVMCKKCGELKKIQTSDWNSQRMRKCLKCLSLNKQQAHIGYENNTYKVIGINVEKSRKNNKRVYYDVVCKNCGEKLTLRWDSIVADTKNAKCAKCKGNNIIPSTNSVTNVAYNRCKQNAISRGFNFSLSKEEFIKLSQKNCSYCGAKPIEVQSLKRYNRTGVPIYMNGIDRIDSTKGYSIENCTACCETCNRMKLNYDINFFYTHVEKIYNYHKSLTTIPRGSTSQAYGDGSGRLPVKEDDIV